MLMPYVFVREDAFLPSLVPLYCGPYLVQERRSKLFPLQLGARTDVVSVDNRFKLAFLSDPISPAVPPPRGRPALQVWDHVFRQPDVLVPCQFFGT